MAIIAVTGFSKAGKSTVIANLAVTLAQECKAVACLPCDWRYPSLSKHFGMELPAEKSIGNIAKGAVPHEVFADCPRARSLFVADISDGENCFSHEPPESKVITDFMRRLADTVDYVILEAGEVQLNRLSYLALDMAQIVVNVVSPTVQGAAWHKATEIMLERCTGGKKLLTVVNGDRNGLWQGRCDIALPYDGSVAQSADKCLPVAFDPSVKCRKYLKAIQKLAAAVRDGGDFS